MLDINNPTTGTSFIDIETGTILTVCLYLFILRLFSPRITSIFYQKLFYTCLSIEIFHMARNYTPNNSSKPHFNQRRQWANPCSLISNIDGATDHYRLKSQWERKQVYLHCFTIALLLIYTIIFQLNGLKPYILMVVSTIHMLIFINLTLSSLLSKEQLFYSIFNVLQKKTKSSSHYNTPC